MPSALYYSTVHLLPYYSTVHLPYYSTVQYTYPTLLSGIGICIYYVQHSGTQALRKEARLG